MRGTIDNGVSSLSAKKGDNNMSSVNHFNTSEKNYLLSIVVPCYNCENTIDRVMRSLLNQKKHGNGIDCAYQIILVNDGSTDETARMCDGYSERYENVTSINKLNGGLVDAWKTGVHSARGAYIAFCDSDDYIDNDFVYTISKIINQKKPDMIAYGMTIEYDNGDKINNDILLKEGYYNKEKIVSDVLPILLSNGDIQTDLLLSSRCNKVINRELLEKVMDDVPNNVSMGEDDIMCFAVALNMRSIFSINNYYPYHYIRNTESMIGAYDEKTFEKIDLIYHVLKFLSKKYCYLYPKQVEMRILSLLFIYIKKEICKNPGSAVEIYKKLKKVRASETFIACYDKNAVDKYSLPNKLFAFWFYNRFFLLLCCVVKLFEMIRGRNV